MTPELLQFFHKCGLEVTAAAGNGKISGIGMLESFIYFPDVNRLRAFPNGKIRPYKLPWNRKAIHIREHEPVIILWTGRDGDGNARAWVRFTRTGKEQEANYYFLDLDPEGRPFNKKAAFVWQ